MNRNIDAALHEVQNRIAQSSKLLPTGIYPPVITKTNPEDKPILWVARTAPTQGPPLYQMIYAPDTLKDQISTIAGVGDVRLGGYVDPNLRVWVDTKKLNHYELTSDDVSSAIQRKTSSSPRAASETPPRTTSSAPGRARKSAAVRRTSASTRGRHRQLPSDPAEGRRHGSGRHLRHVAPSAVPTGGWPSAWAWSNSAAPTRCEVADAVGRRSTRCAKGALPDGMNLAVNFDSTQYIEQAVEGAELHLLLSAVLTALVCWLFLGSWTSTFNVLLAIPTSMIGTFIVLYFSGFTLNTFTLLGLSLSIGIVVDDAIMVLENIVRHQEGGQEQGDRRR